MCVRGCVCAFARIFLCVHVCERIRGGMCARVCTRVCACVRARVCARVSAGACVCMCVYVCASVSKCVRQRM